MREIKYRGKRIDNGEWVYGCYAFSKMPLIEQVDHIIIVNGFKPYSVDPETVGQYTGLKDRNGKNIYEGDIFRPCYNRFKPFVVEYKDGMYNICEYNIKRSEVIGNIYANPSLLEVTHE